MIDPVGTTESSSRRRVVFCSLSSTTDSMTIEQRAKSPRFVVVVSRDSASSRTCVSNLPRSTRLPRLFDTCATRSVAPRSERERTTTS
jgi:hypothetical protein